MSFAFSNLCREGEVSSGDLQLVALVMNRPLAFEFILYGLFLAGVSLIVHYKAPDFGQVTLVTGIAGGALSVLWGVLVLCGYRRRWWIVLTLAVVMFSLLSQAVTAWMRPAGGDASPMRLVAMWITVLLVFSFGLLMNLLHGQGRQDATESPSSSPATNVAASKSAKPAANPSRR